MHQGQRVALNAALMLVKQAIMAVLSVVFVGYLARSVGVDAWGEFQASLAMTAMANVVAGLGVRGYLAREIAIQPELGPRHLGSALALRGATGAVILAAVVAVTLCTRAGLGATLVVIASASQLATTLYSTMWLSFEAHERYQYILYVELGARVFVIALSMCLLWAGYGVIAAAGAFALGNGIELLLTYHFLRRSLYRPRFEATAAELFAIAKASLPFGMVGALLGAMRQTDRVILRLVGDASAVGVYSAAWVLIDQLEMISDLVFGAAFAAGMRLFARDREGFDELFRTSIVVAAALGLPIAAGVCLLAPDVIGLVYGGREGFGEARIVLRLLAWHVLASFALQVVSLPLLASKRESAFARVLVPALAANVVLDVLLVPRYRAQGAAAVAVVVGFASLLGAGWLSFSWVRLAPVRKILSVVVATAAMTGAAYVGRRHLGMWGAVAVGAVVHLALLLALRAVTFDELLSLLRSKPAPRAEPAEAPAEEA